MSGSYKYMINKATELCHNILSTTACPGIKCHIYKDATTIDTQQFVKDEITLQHLYGGIVFMQVSFPGACFLPYAIEQDTMAMTLKAYIKLLNFFHHDYKNLIKRMEDDIQLMQSGERWMMLNPFIHFRGPADITYTMELDANNDVKLTLVIRKEGVVGGKLTATLEYSHDKSSLELPIPSIDILSHDVSILTELLDYKEDDMDVFCQ